MLLAFLDNDKAVYFIDLSDYNELRKFNRFVSSVLYNVW